MSAAFPPAELSGLPGPPGLPELPAFLEEVRNALAHTSFPLALGGSSEARAAVAAAVAQLDDYILPRLADVDAPLLAVVGGSTGAGKSTLVNALVGRPVTRSGAVRPTTRQPILLHHPLDAGWFSTQRVLPSLTRVQAAGQGHSGQQAPQVQPARAQPAPRPAQSAGRPPRGKPPYLPGEKPGRPPGQGALPGSTATLLLQADASIPPGLAILDAPDVDSIDDENRRLAGQLLAAADLWLFVTTANRYADAVPWKLLAEAAQRDILLAVVLDRVPDGVEEEVRVDLLALLAAKELGHAPIFVIPEVPLDSAGMLPPGPVEPVRRWFQALAADAEGRRDIGRRTLTGAVRALGARIGDVADAAGAEQAAGADLQNAATAAFDTALSAILKSTEDGTLLRGEVLARWQDFVGTGEFMRGVETRIGRLRDRAGSFFTGRPAPAETVTAAIESGLHSVIVEEAAKATEAIEARWRADDAGRTLLAGHAPHNSSEFSARAAAEVREWQQDLLELVRSEGSSKRFTARMLSFGVNGVAVALMVVVFASTGGLTGGEVGIAGGSAVVGQKLLEAVFGDDAVRRLARTARDNLRRRCERLLRTEQAKFEALLQPLAGQTPPDVLRGYASTLGTLQLAKGPEVDDGEGRAAGTEAVDPQ
ncbi:energy-coupling factor transporter ATP-binding protein EcfA2 [Arthrobacter sp. CAN_A214]|uniref:dynamin family protein n=1 Tax=Arthrobacter sp. CAN_A214 TaxID=2787720 RepID=UPI0018CB8CEA